MQGNEYGESKELNDLAHSADLSAAAQTPEPRQGVIPIDAPPTMPVTSGVPWGPGDGPDPSVQGLQYAQEPVDDVAAQVIRAAYKAFPSPALRRMVEQLEAEGR